MPNFRPAADPDYTGKLDGEFTSTVVDKANDGKNAFDKTVVFTTSGAPTNAPYPTSITVSKTKTGNRKVKLTWTYAQGALPADKIYIFFREGTAAPTIATHDRCQVLAPTATSYTFTSLESDIIASFAIGAGRTYSDATGVTVGITNPLIAPDGTANAAWSGTIDWIGIPTETVTIDGTVQVDGTTLSTVVTNAAAAVNYSTSNDNNGSPITVLVTNGAVGSSGSTGNGNAAIYAQWDWNGNAANIDGFIIYKWKGGVSDTPDYTDAQEVITINSYANRLLTGSTFNVANTANSSGLVRITTSVAHGFSNGDRVKISGVGGTTEANGQWTIKNVATNTFELSGSVYSNAYTSGGTARKYGNTRKITFPNETENAWHNFWVHAYRRVSPAIADSGVIVQTPVKLNASQYSASGSINITGAVIDSTTTLNGTVTSTVVANASSGATAATGTLTYRTAGAPNGTGASISANTGTPTADGNIVVIVTYAYTQGSIPADKFVIFVNEGADAITSADPAFFTNPTSGTIEFRLKPSTNYNFGFSAARTTESGYVGTTIVTSSTITTVANTALDVRDPNNTSESLYSASERVYIRGNAATDNYSIGDTTTGKVSTSYGNRNIAVGPYALAGSVTNQTYKTDNLGIGRYAFNVLGNGATSIATGGTNNIAIGMDAAKSVTKAVDCIFIGRQVARDAVSPATAINGSIILGASAFVGHTTIGPQNVAIGPYIGGLGAGTLGSQNILIGAYSVSNGGCSGNDNICIGGVDGASGAVTGSENIAIGKGILVGSAASHSIQILSNSATKGISFINSTDTFTIYSTNVVLKPSVSTGTAVTINSGSYANPAWLGSGTRNNTKFLRDDGTWQLPASTGAQLDVVQTFTASQTFQDTVYLYDPLAVTNRLIVGNNVGITTTGAFGGAGLTSRVQSLGNTASSAAYLSLAYSSTDSVCGSLMLGKTRQTTIGALPTAVALGDSLGAIGILGADTTSAWSTGGNIRWTVGATPGASIIPTDVTFNTQNTSGTLTARLELLHTGQVKIASTAINGGSSGTTYTQASTSWLGTGTANSTTYLRGDGTWATVAAGSSNADTLDGLDSTVFLRNDTTNSIANDNLILSAAGAADQFDLYLIGTRATTSNTIGSIIFQNDTSGAANTAATISCNGNGLISVSASFLVGGSLTVNNAISANSMSLTTDLPISEGGTGASSFNAYGVVTGGITTTGALQSVSPGAAGTVLISGGASAVPSWSATTGTGDIVKSTTPTFTDSIKLVSATWTTGAILTVTGNGATFNFDQQGGNILTASSTNGSVGNKTFQTTCSYVSATTANAGNLYTAALTASPLLRSSSSSRFKVEIESVEEQYIKNILNIEPIWFRSNPETNIYDNPNWSYFGFSAEQVASVEPRIVHWIHEKTKLKWDGFENVEVPDETSPLIPDGVMYDRVAVLLLPIVKEHENTITQLKREIEILKAAITT